MLSAKPVFLRVPISSYTKIDRPPDDLESTTVVLSEVASERLTGMGLGGF